VLTEQPAGRMRVTLIESEWDDAALLGSVVVSWR